MKFLRYVLAFLGGMLKVLLVVVGLGFVLLFFFPLLWCIGEGTPVDTPHGPRPVETLRVGDAVVSVTPQGGLAEARVVAVRSSVATWCRRLSFGGGQSLEVTATHPIADTTGWRSAGDLRAGDEVRARDGLVPLLATETRFGLRRVYDLSVAPYENFIAAGLVVHNKTLRDGVRSNEAGAVGDCRAVNSAEVAYSSSNEGFFGKLSCLGAPTSCGWAAGTTPFLDAQLASLQPKQGYARSFVAGARGTGKPDPGIGMFVYVATPLTVGQTGHRGFAIDHTGLVCFTTDGSIPPISNGALAPTCSPLK